MIQKAAVSDLDWMVEISLNKFNKMLTKNNKQSVDKEYLRLVIQKYLDNTYVIPKTSFICLDHIDFPDGLGQVIVLVFSTVLSMGDKLLAYATEICKKRKMTQYGFCGKTRAGLRRALLNRGFNCSSANNCYFFWRTFHGT